LKEEPPKIVREKRKSEAIELNSAEHGENISVPVEYTFHHS
jgi:hypothetical protein